MTRPPGHLARLATAMMLVGALATCSPNQPDPNPAGPSEPASTGHTVVALLSEGASGGQVSTEPVLLDSEAAISDFAGQFTGRTLGPQVIEAAAGAEVATDEVLLAAVVALGCEVPTGATVSTEGAAGGLQIVPTGMPKPTTQCLVPATTVALVTVPASAID